MDVKRSDSRLSSVVTGTTSSDQIDLYLCYPLSLISPICGLIGLYPSMCIHLFLFLFCFIKSLTIILTCHASFPFFINKGPRDPSYSLASVASAHWLSNIYIHSYFPVLCHRVRILCALGTSLCGPWRIWGDARGHSVFWAAPFPLGAAFFVHRWTTFA